MFLFFKYVRITWIIVSFLKRQLFFISSGRVAYFHLLSFCFFRFEPRRFGRLGGVSLVGGIQLLEEYEGEYRVRSQPAVVWSETLPQRENAFVLHQLPEHIQRAGVLWLTIDVFHVLDPAQQEIQSILYQKLRKNVRLQRVTVIFTRKNLVQGSAASPMNEIKIYTIPKIKSARSFAWK